MDIKSLKKAFIEHCSEHKLKKNHEQIKVIEGLIQFYQNTNKISNLFTQFFFKKSNKLGFYLHGDVGVGKTMVLNFFYNYLNIPKQRLHFNEFMIGVHDFLHANKDKSKNENLLELFVRNLKDKVDIVYFDEFQVTNIVDAMILGKLFEIIFKNNIKIVFTSNIKIENLYKDGLQRDQFIPFIKIIEQHCIETELVIKEDYRKSGIKTLERFFYPNNEKTSFEVNQLFREITKEKKQSIEIINTKGRNLTVKNYFEGIARFDFKNLCKDNLGAEDYIAIASKCSFIVIDNIPNFCDENINEQQRFITLIDILYERRIPMMVTCEVSLDKYETSQKLEQVFKRTISRLYELTSPDIKID